MLRLPVRETVKAPPAFGAALALEYRRIVVPIVPGQPSDDALDVACSLAAERGARIVALTVLEVPLELPLDAPLPEEERIANDELDEAVAIGDTYGVRVMGRLVRGRSASVEIVAGRGAAWRGDHRARIAAQEPRRPPPRRVRHDGRPRAPSGALPGDDRGGDEREPHMRRPEPPSPARSAGEGPAGARVSWYSRSIVVFSLVFVVIGIALLVVTAVNGGGVVGFLLGGLFLALGVARIQLERKRHEQ